MRFQPRELVISESSQPNLSEELSHDLKLSMVQTPQADWIFEQEYSRNILLEHFNVATLEGFGLSGKQASIAAAGSLLAYIRNTQRCPLNHISE